MTSYLGGRLKSDFRTGSEYQWNHQFYLPHRVTVTEEIMIPLFMIDQERQYYTYRIAVIPTRSSSSQIMASTTLGSVAVPGHCYASCTP